jgi:hypothetical protein
MKRVPGVRSDQKRFRRAGLIVAIGASLTGCAAGGYDAGAVRSHLIDAGVSPKAADCVVLHMGPRFGDKRLGAHIDASSDERAAMRELLETCNARVDDER